MEGKGITAKEAQIGEYENMKNDEIKNLRKRNEETTKKQQSRNHREERRNDGAVYRGQRWPANL